MRKPHTRAAVRRAGLCLALSLLAAASLHAGTSTLQNPVATFATPGTKDVALTACNSTGCTTIHKTITVLNPTPVVSTAVAAPLVAEVGQLVHLTGTGLGQPPLTFTWQILSGSAQVALLSGASPYWDTTGLAPGVYTATLKIQNGVGLGVSVPLPITLAAAQSSAFYTVEPCRLIDTRNGNFPLVSGAAPLAIDIRLGFCGVPATARALAVNVTAISPTGPGTITFYPGNYPLPITSTVSFNAGVNRSTNAILDVATDASSKIDAVASVAQGGSVHLVLDVFGYFDLPPAL